MAIETAPNKAMKSEDVKNKVVEIDYFFPHGGENGQPLTIKASSQEEANKKLEGLAAKNKKEVE